MREEIEAAINRLKKNRSLGVNNILAEELQAAGQSGVDVMLLLEIRSVEHGICPIAEFASPLLSCAAILAIRP